MKRSARILGLVVIVTTVILLNKLTCIYPTPHTKVIFQNNIRELTYNIDTDREKARLSPKLITVAKEEQVRSYLSSATSPVEALIDLDYSISNKNTIISTSPISELQNNAYIKIKTFTSTIEDIVSNIPFSTILEGSTLCQKLSHKEVDQQGVLGIKTTTIKKYYEGSKLIAEEIIDEQVNEEPKPEIVIIKGPDDSPTDVPQRGYNCGYWWAYIDTISASAEEKQWLKFIMQKESGCNAENDRHSYYKGLYQWDPCLWYKQYPNDNIFDGEAQIRHTLEKLRAGANPNRMWPGTHKLYKATYGELSWIQD